MSRPLPFPTSLPDFQRLFPDDAACATYLEKPVVKAEPTVFAWFTLQVAATWGREPLIIKGEEG